MGLNIKNPETERLIQELAEATGKTLTGTVTDAVREKLDRVRRKGLADRLMAIGKECAEIIANTPGTMMEIEDLYDEETGLPK